MDKKSKNKLGRILTIKRTGNKEEIKKENEARYNYMFNRNTGEVKPEVIARITHYYNASKCVKWYKQIEYYWDLDDVLKQFNLKRDVFNEYCNQYGIEFNKSTRRYDIPLELMQRSFTSSTILEYNKSKKEINNLEKDLIRFKDNMDQQLKIYYNKINELEEQVKFLKRGLD